MPKKEKISFRYISLFGSLKPAKFKLNDLKKFLPLDIKGDTGLLYFYIEKGIKIPSLFSIESINKKGKHRFNVTVELNSFQRGIKERIKRAVGLRKIFSTLEKLGSNQIEGHLHAQILFDKKNYILTPDIPFDKISGVSFNDPKKGVANLESLEFNFQNSKLGIEHLLIDISSDKFLSISTLSKITFEINKELSFEFYKRAIEATKIFVKEKKEKK